MSPTIEHLEPVVESRFGLDGGAMFGVVPKPLWERANPADERNRIAMVARCLYLEVGDRRVLIDAGMGSRWSERHLDIYALSHPDGTLVSHLSRLGVAADSVTDVIMTHLHFDHVGGLAVGGPSGPQPAFPRARHWVQAESWAWAHSPSVRDAGSFRLVDFAFLSGPDGPVLELLDGHGEVLPGVKAISTRGHTPGMQVLELSYRGATVVYCADLIPTLAHIPVPWVMGYDVYPLTTCSEKAEILANALRHDWILAVEHDPEHAFARVERDERGRYKAGPRANMIEELL